MLKITRVLAERRSEIWSGVLDGAAWAIVALLLALPLASLVVNAPRAPPLAAVVERQDTASAQPKVDAARLSTDTSRLIAWVLQSRDNAGLPFVVLDKRDARVTLFDARGRVIGESPVLLGAAAGDDSVAGIGTRPIQQVRVDERTTPAGRFRSEPGKNAAGEQVVWVDYDAAVSMHRVRPVDPKERRLERLASPDPAQRRISYGCINVPVAFFEAVVWPVLGRTRAIVYVLPESKRLDEVFPAVGSPTAALTQGRRPGRAS